MIKIKRNAVGMKHKIPYFYISYLRYSCLFRIEVHRFTPMPTLYHPYGIFKNHNVYFIYNINFSHKIHNSKIMELVSNPCLFLLYTNNQHHITPGLVVLNLGMVVNSWVQNKNKTPKLN